MGIPVIGCGHIDCVGYVSCRSAFGFNVLLRFRGVVLGYDESEDCG